MQPPYQATALYEYRSAHEDDLNFNAGQIIYVSGAEDDEWLIGSYHDETGTLLSGLFPRNFVEVLGSPTPTPSTLPEPLPHIADSGTRAHIAATGTTARENAPVVGQPHGSSLVSGVPETSASASTAQRSSTVRTKSPPNSGEQASSGSKNADLGTASKALETAQLSTAIQTDPAAKQPIQSSAEPTTDSRMSPTSRSLELRTSHTVTVEKPQKVNAFKDRIAAFNKQETTPIAPKPMSKPSLAKKPFIAPPPSKSAFLLQTQNLPPSKTTASDTGSPNTDQLGSKPVINEQYPTNNLSDTKFQPRPGSLKDRIAALQAEKLQLASRGDSPGDEKSQPENLSLADLETHKTPVSASGPVNLSYETDESFKIKEPTIQSSRLMSGESPEGNDIPTTIQSSGLVSGDSIPENNQTRSSMYDSEHESNFDLSSQPHKSENAPLHAAADSASITHIPESVTSIQAGDSTGSGDDQGQALDEEQNRKEQLRQRMAKMSGMGMGMHMALGMSNTRQPTAKKAQVQSPHVDTEITDMSTPIHPEATHSPDTETTSFQVAGPLQEVRDVLTASSTSEALGTDTDASPLRSNSRHTRVTSARRSADTSQLMSPEDEITRSYSNTTDPSFDEAITASTLAEKRDFPPVPSRPEARSQSMPSDTDQGKEARSTRQMPPIPSSLPSPTALGRDEEKGRSIDDQIVINSAENTRILIPDTSRIPEVSGSTETGIDIPHSIAINEANDLGKPLSPGVARPPPPVPQAGLYGDRDVRLASPLTRKPPPVPTASSTPPRPAAVAPILPRCPAPAVPARTAPDVKESDELDASTDSTASTSDLTEPRSPQLVPRLYPDPVPVEVHSTAHQELPVVRSSTDSTRAQRRSIDSRKETYDDYMAKDIDVAPSSHWWTRRDATPPALQNRQDLCYEMDETSSTRRGGRKTITKEIYILYYDYSQSIVSAQFEADDVDNISFKQEHKRPPLLPTREKLEQESARFGQSIVSLAYKRLGTTVGSGESIAFVREIFGNLPEALPAAGMRGYGVPIYTNIGNASIASADEIRPGDILSFRNAKLTGHKGAMKSKYNVEVGKPDHCAVVSDWDGTKRKVKCYEQGRDGRKVSQVSYKLDDLKSGEARIWRVMSRDYVGWNSP